MEIKRYDRHDEQSWNDTVAASRNGTFLFDRRYMDYHADRFADHSYLFYEHGSPIALFPCNRQGEVAYSHQGLTYGGLVMSAQLTTQKACELFCLLNDALRADGIRRVIYKAVPHIYHRYPCEEDLYALVNVCGAHVAACHISSTLPLDSGSLKWCESRLSGLRKARRKALEVRESTDIEAFWQILDGNLQQKYQSHPVHSAAEIRLLQSRFPEAIRLYMAYDGNEPLGGTLLYLTPTVVHTQYISATAAGKACGALDMLFHHLLQRYAGKARWFDFGKSSDGDGHALNGPLIFQKEGFGGRGVCYNWWEWSL